MLKRTVSGQCDMMAGQPSVGGSCIHIERWRKRRHSASDRPRIRPFAIRKTTEDHENIRLRIPGEREEKTDPSSKRRVWIERNELSVRDG